MSAKPLTVLAKVKPKPGKEAEVLKHLLSLVEPSRKDPGCLNYDLHRSSENPTAFVFHENWVSREHLDRHLAKPDLQATLAQVGTLVVEPPEITLWEKLA
jgi:quinol monooxygenase YgiN